MPAIPPAAGLCATCRFADRIETARGSVFVLCARSRSDLRFQRYPVLPVRQCTGMESLTPEESGGKIPPANDR